VIYICLIGSLLLIPIVAGNAWYLVNIFRGRRAHIRIAEAGNFRLLNDATADIQKIFGGEIDGHEFAFRPAADLSRSYNDGRSSVSVHMRMQILFPIYNSALAGVSIKKRNRVRAIPESFDEIWSLKPSPAAIPNQAKEALYDFAARNAHKSGLDGTIFRFSKSVRKITIIERALWKHSMPPEIFPKATCQLVYDHPQANLKIDEFNHLVRELGFVASSLEPQIVEAEIV